jgi:hypothetical protein
MVITKSNFPLNLYLALIILLYFNLTKLSPHIMNICQLKYADEEKLNSHMILTED